MKLHFRFHDLRHTAASLRLTQGDHTKVVQELLDRIALQRGLPETIVLARSFAPTLVPRIAEH